jgi:hypothetical protein
MKKFAIALSISAALAIWLTLGVRLKPDQRESDAASGNTSQTEFAAATAFPESFPEVATSPQDPTMPRRRSRTLEDQAGSVGVNSQGFPIWKTDPDFKHDAFTFARVRYTSGFRDDDMNRGGRRFRRYYDWSTDWPEADNNFSYRLAELTSFQVNPEPVVVTFDGEEIYDYPFVYLVEPGHMKLTEAEVEGLRKYLLRGGFLLVDDFWGEFEYETLLINLKRVFPDRVPQELPIEHEIFNIVYKLNEKVIVPSVHSYLRGAWTERPDAREAYVKGMFDDQGRLMMVICHNTDLGDGWEREGVDEGYFRKYAEPYAYPLGINIIVYAMTH